LETASNHRAVFAARAAWAWVRDERMFVLPQESGMNLKSGVRAFYRN
jgi:hypothetical protein